MMRVLLLFFRVLGSPAVKLYQFTLTNELRETVTSSINNRAKNTRKMINTIGISNTHQNTIMMESMIRFELLWRVVFVGGKQLTRYVSVW